MKMSPGYCGVHVPGRSKVWRGNSAMASVPSQETVAVLGRSSLPVQISTPELSGRAPPGLK